MKEKYYCHWIVYFINHYLFWEKIVANEKVSFYEVTCNYQSMALFEISDIWSPQKTLLF